MRQILIDNDYSKYYPLFTLSTLISGEYNISKHETGYIIIDNINVFKKYYKYIDKKYIFLYSNNISFDEKEINVRIISNKDEIELVDFKKKLINHDYIYDYLISK